MQKKKLSASLSRNTYTHTHIYISSRRKGLREREREEEKMGSGYYGEPNLGNENNQRGNGSSSSSSSSSRKGKKSNSDKPRQPQRGLGVAQLEKIRLHSQMAASLHNPYPTHFNHVISLPYFFLFYFLIFSIVTFVAGKNSHVGFWDYTYIIIYVCYIYMLALCRMI